MSVFIYIFAKNDVIMKKFIVFFIFVISVAQINIIAQDFVADGNVWTYKDLGYLMGGWLENDSIYRFDDDNLPLHEVTTRKYYFNGDTIINGRQYKQMWYNACYETFNPLTGQSMSKQMITGAYIISLREQDGKVFVNKDEYWKRILLRTSLPTFYDSIDEMDLPIEGDEVVLYDFNQQVDGILPFIGSLETLLLPFVETERNRSPDSIIREESLNLFFRGDELVYQAPDFYPDPFFPEVKANGIEDIEFESKEKVDTRIFNLKGQQLSAPQRGINIIGGKKVYIR